MLKKPISFALCSIISVAITFTGNYVAANSDHSEIQDRFCTICHTSIPLPPSFPSPGGLPFDITTHCNKCHTSEREDHAVGIPPTSDVSDILPLDKGGNIDCNTCHDAHNKSGNAMMLRKAPLNLCPICHEK